MPDIDYLMQEWPAEFEGVLSSTHLPTADLDCDLATYVEIICSESPGTACVACCRPLWPADAVSPGVVGCRNAQKSPKPRCEPSLDC